MGSDIYCDQCGSARGVEVNHAGTYECGICLMARTETDRAVLLARRTIGAQRTMEGLAREISEWGYRSEVVPHIRGDVRMAADRIELRGDA